MSDKSRERSYLPESELEIPGTIFIFCLFEENLKAEWLHLVLPQVKDGLACKELLWLSGVQLRVIIKQEPFVLHHLTAFSVLVRLIPADE